MNEPTQIKRMLLSALIALCHTAVSGQLSPQNTAIIWNGFDHAWTYNHRCNRMGNYVTCNDGKPQATHISATGIGADSTYFNSYYTTVTTPDMVFKEGVAHIKIQSKEKQLSEGTEVVTIACGQGLCNKNYSGLLNGYSLVCERAPDKIELMRLHVEDPVYNAVDNTLTLRINYSLVFNCQSVECPEFDQQVEYALDVYYLVAAFDKADGHAAQFFFTRSYSWDKKEAVNDEPETKKICGTPEPGFKKAFVGIKGFSVVLNEAHWLFGLNSNILYGEYDSLTGCAEVSADLLFREWQEGMKKSGVSGKSQFSVKRSGWAMMDLDIALLQLKDGTIATGNRSGKMFWKSGKRKAEMRQGETVIPVSPD